MACESAAKELDQASLLSSTGGSDEHEISNGAEEALYGRDGRYHMKIENGGKVGKQVENSSLGNERTVTRNKIDQNEFDDESDEDDDENEEDDEDGHCDNGDNESMIFEESEYWHEMMTPGYLCKGYFLSFTVRQETLLAIRGLDIDQQDVFLAGYPRSGITWTQRIIGAMRDGPDVVKQPDYDLTLQFPFIEYYDIFNEPLYDGFSLFNSKSPPRVVKTHLPCQLIPRAFEDGGKVVVILRNPKDMIVSYYNLMKNLTMVNYIASFEEYFEIFKNEHAPYGNWFKWVKSWWEAKQNKTIKNIHFLIYENLFTNTREEVEKLAEYLGYQLDPDNMSSLLESIGISSMQQTVYFPGLSNFVRRGGVGGWKKVLTNQMSEWIDEMLQRELYDHQFPFKFTFE